MTAMKKPWERLDALLAGIENDVLLSDQAESMAAGEVVGIDETRKMRWEIESLIQAQSSGLDGSIGRARREESKGTKAKVAHTLERLGRWARFAERGRGSGGSKQLRMAFSGEDEKKRGEGASRRVPQRRGKGTTGGKGRR